MTVRNMEYRFSIVKNDVLRGCAVSQIVRAAGADDRTRQARGDLRRQQILDAAVELFATKGYRGAGVAALAERVGMTATGLLYYFGSKERLLQEVVAERSARRSPADRLRPPAPEPPGPRCVQLGARRADEALHRSRHRELRSGGAAARLLRRSLRALAVVLHPPRREGAGARGGSCRRRRGADRPGDPERGAGSRGAVADGPGPRRLRGRDGGLHRSPRRSDLRGPADEQAGRRQARRGDDAWRRRRRSPPASTCGTSRVSSDSASRRSA